MSADTEIELKFQIPTARLPALRRAVATAGATRTHLQAVYADTADGRLAAAGIALRLRQEGSDWVQTLKGRGDGLMVRLEHEVALPPQRDLPQLDIARHAGTPAHALLLAALGEPAAALLPIYRTDIQRTHRVLKSGGARIEIALDEGAIHGGDRQVPVSEIEFELLSGPPQALLALAARWVQRHGLWLDVRTKAERGHRLALGIAQVPAVRAGETVLHREMTPQAALAAMLRSALAQVLPNAAEIGNDAGSAEQVHQLRVGLRRLRCALRTFGGWAGGADAVAACAALEAGLRAPFTRLGGTRDRDALSAVLLPAMQAAGAPEMPLADGAPAEDPGAVVRDPAFSVLLQRAIALSLPPMSVSVPKAAPSVASVRKRSSASASWALPGKPAAGTPAASPLPFDDGPAELAETADLRRLARQRLRALHRRALADAEGFASATEEAQHRTRKRLKRLRYALEFSAALFEAKPVARQLKALRRTLDVLGEYNDLLVALALYRAAAAQEPRAWFAIGWLQARRETLLARCERSLALLAAVKPGWR